MQFECYVIVLELKHGGVGHGRWWVEVFGKKNLSF